MEMNSLETLDPATLGLERKRRRMRSHADRKLRLRHRRKNGVASYQIPLRTADLTAWLRLLGKIAPTGEVTKAELEIALGVVIAESIAIVRV
jgi:hypothetical protein